MPKRYIIHTESWLLLKSLYRYLLWTDHNIWRVSICAALICLYWHSDIPPSEFIPKLFTYHRACMPGLMNMYDEKKIKISQNVAKRGSFGKDCQFFCELSKKGVIGWYRVKKGVSPSQIFRDCPQTLQILTYRAITKQLKSCAET